MAVECLQGNEEAGLPKSRSQSHIRALELANVEAQIMSTIGCIMDWPSICSASAEPGRGSRSALHFYPSAKESNSDSRQSAGSPNWTPSTINVGCHEHVAS
jgi:hypothetical protein